MRSIKFFIAALILISSLAHAEESAIDKTKDSAVELWENAKEATIELVDKASEKASVMGGKASETGSKASKAIKETGVIVWDAMKEVGSATAESTKKGVEKIRQLNHEKSNESPCSKDSALCYKNN